jgi:hypothetical protein
MAISSSGFPEETDHPQVRPPIRVSGFKIQVPGFKSLETWNLKLET